MGERGEIRLSDNAVQVLKARYLAKDDNGNVVEEIPEMFRRVASAVASADRNFGASEKEVSATEEEFYDMMTQLKFMPNSPTLMNAGRPLGQLSACFVLPVEDSMNGIFDSVKNAALIHKSGGGTGFSFSRLRPKGSTVASTGGVASGPVSFMKVFNAATEAVKQGGTRRGANMGILRVDHPDIMEFISCKENLSEITNFNISVGLTEEFMKAVEEDKDYDLIDPHTKEAVGSLSAKEVFDNIVDHAWRNGEPGIIFLDRVNNDNVLPTQGEIESTNPCGEQPLLPYESCNLGSINLSAMLKPDNSGFDYPLLESTVRSAVHFLDNVIEINQYPLEVIEKQSKASRKIGLGVMGWADALLKLGISYDSEEARKLGGRVMSFIRSAGRACSHELAVKRGPFPLFEESTLASGETMRNATVTTIAPTGTISMIAGCSSGIEPIFSYAFKRHILDGRTLTETNPILAEELKKEGLYTDDILEQIVEHGSLQNISQIPESIKNVFVTAHDISYYGHIKMQAAFQEFTDNAVSKTVNFRKEATRDDIADVYKLAYKTGCKGVTVYRDGSRDTQVLTVGSGDEKKKQEPAKEKPAVQQNVEPRPRPAITRGFTEKVKIGCGKLYVTTNYDENGICEVFTSTGKGGGCPSQSEATARLVSLSLRSGISLDNIYHQLKGIRCPSTVRQQGMGCTSCPDAIARVLMKVEKEIESEKDKGSIDPEAMEPITPSLRKNARAEMPEDPDDESSESVCPECGSSVEHEGGCVICRQCGWSKCG
ncbi:MAG: vitamin B12-dependent ribonucleotide reductase [Anaerovoracaceae bacterium]